MAEIIGPLIGGIGTLAGMSSAQESAMIQMMNLQFQRRMADEQMRMSQATRTDAYGNQMRYNPATNSWEMILTPTQKGIIGAQEQEQLKSLTEDATRNRQILEEARQRGFQAQPDYAKAISGFRYDEAPSRAADEDKLASLLAIQRQDAAGKSTQDVGRQLLRQGRGADLPIIMKAADDRSGQSIGGDLLKSYEASIPQYTQDVQMRQSRYLPVIKQLQETMAGGSSAPPRFSTTPQELSTIQGQQMNSVLSALSSGSREVGGAYSGLAKAVGDTAPDMKGLASIITAFKNNKGNQPQYGIVPNQDTSGGDAGSGFLNDEEASNLYNNFFNGGGSF
jgi:hypothetical protein